MIGIPAAILFEDVYFRTNGRNYDIHPIGDRFLKIKDENIATDTLEGVAAMGQINIVLNWYKGLLARLPVE